VEVNSTGDQGLRRAIAPSDDDDNDDDDDGGSGGGGGDDVVSQSWVGVVL
jgi:hypothetical protein